MNDKTNLTPEELAEIASYTIQKIESFPKEWGKTVENYFDVLFPDEVNNYLTRRGVNQCGERRSA